MNAMSVDVLSNFGKVLRNVIKETEPKKIIETGTYLGKGTTTVIASAIRDFKIEKAKFHSIEVNPNYFRSAYIHLRDADLLGFVNLVNGLSIYRNQLPSREKIKEEFVDKNWPDGVYIDHNKNIRVHRYFDETNFEGVPDGMLLTCLNKSDYSPDLVLLDSGGHVGGIEFNVVISHVKNPCIIALDDTLHVKHYNSLQRILSDSRFSIIEQSKEKFGFCIAKFHPEG